MPTKICRKCGFSGTLDDFPKRIDSKDGRKSVCRSCENARLRDYKFRHRDELNQKYSEYHKSHPEKAHNRVRKWRSIPENAEKNRQYARAIYWADVEVSREISNAKKKTDLGKARARRYNSNRRLLSDRVINDLSHKDVEFLLEIQSGQCGCCHRGFSKNIPYTVDHIVPVKLGGRLTLSNAQLLCRNCNSSKGAKIIRYVFDSRLTGG